MTYRRFHLVFNLPVLALLGALQPWSVWMDLYVPTMLPILGIVMVFTTPWDDFAVARGIWDFPADRILFRIRHLPVEEYAFFVIQALQVMMLAVVVLRSNGVDNVPSQPLSILQWGMAGGVVLLWAVIGRWQRGIGERRPAWHYAWHLLYWFVPVVLLQWAVAGSILIDHWQAVILPFLIIGTYLSLADLYAVRQGIWFFDRRQITGRYVAGILPWEEVAFFYITSLVVAQSMVMLLPDGAR